MPIGDRVDTAIWELRRGGGEVRHKTVLLFKVQIQADHRNLDKIVEVTVLYLVHRYIFEYMDYERENYREDER